MNKLSDILAAIVKASLVIRLVTTHDIGERIERITVELDWNKYASRFVD